MPTPVRLTLALAWVLLPLAAACSSGDDASSDGGDAPSAAAETGSDGPGGSTDGTAELRPADGGVVPDGGAAPDAPAANHPAAAWAPPCSNPCPPFMDVIDLDVLSLALDRGRGRLYATMRGAMSPESEGLAIIDPMARRIVRTMAVGPAPRALALSDDASTLWIAVDGANAVRRLDVTTDPPQLGPLQPLPRYQRLMDELTAVGSMVVLTGQPRSILVTLTLPRLSSSFGAYAVLDDGVARPMPPSTDFCDSFRLTPGPAGYVFGSGNGGDLCGLKIAATGVTVTRHSGLGTGEPERIADRIYGRFGEAIDISNPDMPRRAGKFAFRGAILPQTARRVLMLSVSSDVLSGSPLLRVLEGDNFTETGSVAVMGFRSTVSNVVQFDDDKIAMIEGSGGFGSAARIVFLQHPLIRQ